MFGVQAWAMRSEDLIVTIDGLIVISAILVSPVKLVFTICLPSSLPVVGIFVQKSIAGGVFVIVLLFMIVHRLEFWFGAGTVEIETVIPDAGKE